ncbi:MAG: acyl-CoA synthetase [Hyphomicrobiales bacterium]
MPSYGYSGDLPPDSFNMAAYCLRESAAKTPDKPGLIVCPSADPLEAEIWTYSALEDTVLRIAHGISSYGFEPGSRVFLRMHNSVDYALMFLGLSAAGFVPIPGSSQLTADEVAFMAGDASISAIAFSPELEMPELPGAIVKFAPDDIDALKSGPRGTYKKTRKDDPAFLIYTSGTSGKPKGVLHAQRAVWGRRPMYRGWYGIDENDVMLHTGHFNWTYTLGTGLMDPWASGATTIVYTGPQDATVWPKLARAHSATIIGSVPTLYRQILKYNNINNSSFPALRHGLTAGEPIPLEAARSWSQATGTVLYEALGMSEISTYISCSPEVPIKPGSPGRAQKGRCVAILPVEGSFEPLPAGEIGLLAIHRSDPGIMLGYWRRPEEEAEVMYGDWFAGGDLARMDEDGYIWFEGRNDDLMNAMGYRVSPVEVEKALSDHISVGEVAVAERRMRVDVSVIAAYVVPADGHSIDKDGLIAHAARHLAAYKTPREVIIVDRLPRTANGKLMRRALQSMSPSASNS